jgi:hypothetical protein
LAAGWSRSGWLVGCVRVEAAQLGMHDETGGRAVRLDLGNDLMRPGIVFRGKRGDSEESNASAVSAGSDEADRASPRPKSARPKSWDKTSSARFLFCAPVR